MWKKGKNRPMDKKKKRGFSKKLLIADYVIAIIMIVVFFVCAMFNGVYVASTTTELLQMRTDMLGVSISAPFNLDIFGIFLSTWIIQLGVSSAAYYSVIKSEHKMQMPMMLLEDLPQDIKENIDMTQVITTVLTSTDN